MGGMLPFLDWIGGKGKIIWNTLTTVCRLTVDYNKSLQEMSTTKNIDSVDSNITDENFPKTLSGVVEVDVELVHFNRKITYESVLAELDEMGMRPATIWELIAFAAKYEESQLAAYYVKALGSQCDVDGRPCTALLTRSRSGWGVILEWRGFGVSIHTQCLAVRK